jgi:hypothetical protein
MAAMADAARYYPPAARGPGLCSVFSLIPFGLRFRTRCAVTKCLRQRFRVSQLLSCLVASRLATTYTARKHRRLRVGRQVAAVEI